MRPPATSAGSHAGHEQLVAPPGNPTRLISPVVPPEGGPIARIKDPEPDAEIVVLDPLHVVPSESTVMTPWTVEVPTVTCDPPSTFSGTQPVGSSTHNAGGPPVRLDGRMVAERVVVEPDTPKMREKIAWSRVRDEDTKPPAL